jgi:hypothetical protein
MQNNSLFSGGALARTILPITLICALGVASARGQATNVTWNRQALGQTVGGSCGPTTNLTYWSVTYPNDNNWSQSVVEGSTACGAEVVQPSNWSIPQYPNSTNYNVIIGGDVYLDVNVTVNSVTISLGGELDIPNQSVLSAAVVDVDGGAITGWFTNTTLTTITSTNTSTFSSLGQGNSMFVNQGLVQQAGAGGLLLGGAYASPVLNNTASGTYKFLTDSGIANSGQSESAPWFQNQGLVWKSGGVNVSLISIPFNNLGGSVQVDSGTLRLSAGGNSSNGTFIVAGGATLDLTGGNSPSWSGTLGGSGAGQVSLSSGTLNASPAMILNFPSNVFQWSGGALSGPVTNTGVVNVSGTNHSYLTGGNTVFVNQGMVQQMGAGGLLLGNAFASPVLNNTAGGTYKFLTDSGIASSGAYDSAPWFQNQGLVWKSAGTNTSIISLPFVNQGGAIRVDSGTLSLNGGSYVQGGGALTISLGGLNAGQVGQLSVGSASLGGPLNVIVANGFVGAVGSRFQILACSSLSGAFTSISAPTNISVSYSASGLFLTVTNVALITPVQITSAQLSGNNFNFGFQTVNNQSYTVQENTNLARTNWLLYTNFIGNGSALQLTVPVSAAPQQFFRVREP